jgi:hypothetical protein
MTRRRTLRSVAVGSALLLASGLVATGVYILEAPRSTPVSYHLTRFHAADFVDPLTAGNKWFPLRPGTQLIKEGTTLIGNRKVPYEVITTVTDVERMIEGVPTVAVYDYETGGGLVTQRSLDYLAQDRLGNLWVMGGATEAWEAGRYVEVGDVWMSGVHGDRGGILVPADLGPSSPAWAIAQHGQEESVSKFVGKEKVCVPFGCFPTVLITREGTATGPNNEYKYFALGIGQIRNQPRRDSRHADTELLINAVRLSPQGLASASADALQIDGRAAAAFPRFYPTPTARRVHP